MRANTPLTRFFEHHVKELSSSVPQLEPGLRYWVNDAILSDSCTEHRETSLFAVRTPDTKGTRGMLLLYESRSKFAYEVIDSQQALLWRLDSKVDWTCDSSHVLCPQQCIVRGGFLANEALEQLESEARASGGGGTPSHFKLVDGEDYVQPDASNWHAQRLKSGFFKRPVWIIYETSHTGTVIELMRDNSLRTWRSTQQGLFRSGVGSNFRVDKLNSSCGALADMRLTLLTQTRGLVALVSAITKHHET